MKTQICVKQKLYWPMNQLIIATVVLLICSTQFKTVSGWRSIREFSIPRERKILGEGSFGMVEVAIDTKNGQQCALKHMDPNDRSTGLELKVAKRVEQMTVSLGTCPYMVQTLAFDVGPREVQTVMELAEGGDLFRFILTHERLPEPLVKLFTIQLALALRCMHDMGILWLDGKPENTLLILNEDGEQSGRLKIADFGLSEIVDPRNPFTPSSAGTIKYMPPEVHAREARGYASDWWTLGIMVYEMLTGRLPFMKKEDGSDFVEKLLHYYAGDDRMLKFPDHVTAGPKNLVKKLLSRYSTQRFGVLSNGYVSDANGVLYDTWLQSDGFKTATGKTSVIMAIQDETFDVSGVIDQLKSTKDPHLKKVNVDQVKADRGRQQEADAREVKRNIWKRDEQRKEGHKNLNKAEALDEEAKRKAIEFEREQARIKKEADKARKKADKNFKKAEEYDERINGAKEKVKQKPANRGDTSRDHGAPKPRIHKHDRDPRDDYTAKDQGPKIQGVRYTKTIPGDAPRDDYTTRDQGPPIPAVRHVHTVPVGVPRDNYTTRDQGPPIQVRYTHTIPGDAPSYSTATFPKITDERDRYPPSYQGAPIQVRYVGHPEVAPSVPTAHRPHGRLSPQELADLNMRSRMEDRLNRGGRNGYY